MSARVVHFEVPYDDGDRARSFYRDVFGWEITNVLPDLSELLLTLLKCLVV
jgi:predicted enzyme related to lactoylglutathione lyase